MLISQRCCELPSPLMWGQVLGYYSAWLQKDLRQTEVTEALCLEFCRSYNGTFLHAHEHCKQELLGTEESWVSKWWGFRFLSIF